MKFGTMPRLRYTDSAIIPLKRSSVATVFTLFDDRSGSLLCDKNIGEYYSIREWQDCRVVMNLNECIQDYDELSRGEVVPGARKSAEGLK